MTGCLPGIRLWFRLCTYKRSLVCFPVKLNHHFLKTKKRCNMTSAEFKRQQLFKQRLQPMEKEYVLGGIMIFWLLSCVLAGVRS